MRWIIVFGLSVIVHLIVLIVLNEVIEQSPKKPNSINSLRVQIVANSNNSIDSSTKLQKKKTIIENKTNLKKSKQNVKIIKNSKANISNNIQKKLIANTAKRSINIDTLNTSIETVVTDLIQEEQSSYTNSMFNPNFRKAFINTNKLMNVTLQQKKNNLIEMISLNQDTLRIRINDKCWRIAANTRYDPFDTSIWMMDKNCSKER